MSYWKSFSLAIFAALCLLGETPGAAQAQSAQHATEWSGGKVVNLGGLPGYTQSGAHASMTSGR